MPNPLSTRSWKEIVAVIFKTFVFSSSNLWWIALTLWLVTTSDCRHVGTLANHCPCYSVNFRRQWLTLDTLTPFLLCATVSGFSTFHLKAKACPIIAWRENLLVVKGIIVSISTSMTFLWEWLWLLDCNVVYYDWFQV